MDQYPGNSRRPINPSNSDKPNVPVDEGKKLEKVVTGRVVRRKKTLGRRLKETFFGGDSSSVFGYLGKEVLLPALQNLITDFVTQGIEKAVYGEVRHHRPTGYRGGYRQPTTHISYDRPTSAVRPSQPPPARRPPNNQPVSFQVGEVILESKVAAQLVAEKLYETLEEYNCVTVSNLNELLGETSQYTDHKWGWTDLDGLEIKHIREGYLLMLPDPEDLR